MAFRAVWALRESAARPSVTSLLCVLFFRHTLAQFWCLLIHTRNWKSTVNRTWSDTVVSASMKFLLTCEWPVGKQCSLCRSHTGVCNNNMWKHANRTFPRPRCSAKNHRDIKDPSEGVVYGSFYSCSSLQRGWVAFARAVFGKGVGSFLAGGTELLTQPWQDRSSLFQGYLGSAYPGCEFPLLLHRSFSIRLARGKSASICVVVSFLPLLLLPDQYLSGISLVAKIPSACWNKECIYLHGLAWWAFPISHLKKKVWGLKLFLKAFEFFYQTERERWLRAQDIWLQNVFFQDQGPNSEHLLEVFLWCVCFWLFFLKRSWKSKWYYWANCSDCFLLLAHSPGE